MTTTIIIAIIFFFAGCAITFIYNNLNMNKFKTYQENKYEQFTSRTNDKYTQFTEQLNDTHKQFAQQLNGRYQNLTDELDRLTKTEANAIYLKADAYIVFIHKARERGDERATPFVNLQKVVSSEYRSVDDNVRLDKFEDWENDVTLKDIFNMSSPDKLVLFVMNDDLFKEFKPEGREFTPEHAAIIKPFFDTLKSKQIGFINVGRSPFRQFGMQYIGFANEAYSAYSNINNLLKYMMYAKDIKPTQKRKF